MGFIAQIGTGGMIFIAILIVLFNVFLIYSRSKRIRQAMKAAKDERIALEKAQADSVRDSEQDQDREREKSLM